MFENPKRGKQARNFTTNVPNILDLKSSSKQIFSKNWRWVPLSHFMVRLFNLYVFCCWGKKRSCLLCPLRCFTEELQLSTLFIFKGLFIIFLHGPPPPHQYRWLESECSIFVWTCPLKNEIWRMNFLSAHLNARGVQFCRILPYSKIPHAWRVGHGWRMKCPQMIIPTKWNSYSFKTYNCS